LIHKGYKNEEWRLSMITMFNRRELYTTFSMKEQANIREILTGNNIDYVVKTINRNSPSALSDTRARTGTFGQNKDYEYEYIIYVPKAMLNEAKELIGKISK
jgi:hypothetical protein